MEHDAAEGGAPEHQDPGLQTDPLGLTEDQLMRIADEEPLSEVLKEKPPSEASPPEDPGQDEPPRDDSPSQEKSPTASEEDSSDEASPPPDNEQRRRERWKEYLGEEATDEDVEWHAKLGYDPGSDAHLRSVRSLSQQVGTLGRRAGTAEEQSRTISERLARVEGQLSGMGQREAPLDPMLVSELEQELREKHPNEDDHRIRQSAEFYARGIQEQRAAEQQNQAQRARESHVEGLERAFRRTMRRLDMKEFPLDEFLDWANESYGQQEIRTHPMFQSMVERYGMRMVIEASKDPKDFIRLWQLTEEKSNGNQEQVTTDQREAIARQRAAGDGVRGVKTRAPVTRHPRSPGQQIVDNKPVEWALRFKWRNEHHNYIETYGGSENKIPEQWVRDMREDLDPETLEMRPG